MVNVPEDLKIRAAAAPLRPAITTLRWRDAVLAAGLGLSCCTAAGPNPADSPAGQVTVAPGIVYCLPSPAALERSVEAFQLITVRHGYDTFAFETRISVTPARVLVVGIDMLGRRAMTIEWTGGNLKVEAAPWVPPQLRARNVIADIMMLHWPAAAVQAGLKPGTTMRDTDPAHRVIVADGRDMISIDRIAGVPGSWSGQWTYRNVGWGYDLDIQSAEEVL